MQGILKLFCVLILRIWNFIFKQNYCCVCGKRDYPWNLRPYAFHSVHDSCALNDYYFKDFYLDGSPYGYDGEFKS